MTIAGRRAASAAFSETLAKRRIFSRKARPAFSAALPVTKVWREAEVLPASGRDRRVGALQPECVQRQAERVGADLGDDGVRALADIDGALVQDDVAVGRDADPDGRRIGQRGVAAAIPAGGDADAALAVSLACVEGSGIGERARPMRPQRLEALGDADARLQPLAGDRFGAVPKAVLQAEVEPVDAELAGQLVVERLLHDRRLRHAEAAEGAGDRPDACGWRGPRRGSSASHRGRRHAPARGWRRSAPSWHRRRC